MKWQSRECFSVVAYLCVFVRRVTRLSVPVRGHGRCPSGFDGQLLVRGMFVCLYVVCVCALFGRNNLIVFA